MTNNLLADVVDIRRWLEVDAQTPFDRRVARDREIGRSLDSSDDLKRVLGWWRTVRTDDVEHFGLRLTRLVGLACVLLFAGGLLFGMAVSSVAFGYDGSHPVNLLALLGVLVGTPLILLVLTLIFLLPVRLPGVDAVRDAVSVLNPGRWVGAWLDRFSGLRLHGGFSTRETAFARWQLSVFSQWFAIGFFTGVLLLGWMRVAVTDLAFGWSTTLEVDAATIHAVFGTLSIPWQNWLPAAVPDLNLVEVSRFNRLETAPISTERAVQLGGWWPFVLMTIVVYGLVPRLLLLAVGRWRAASATRSMLCQNSEVVGLLDRLAAPHLGFEQEEEDGAVVESGRAPAPPLTERAGNTGILIYNDALGSGAAASWAGAELGVAGARSAAVGVWLPSDDVREKLAAFGSDLERLVVFTKGWEPPLLEFSDLLSLTRENIGNDATIVVVPIDAAGSRVTSSDRDVWARFLARHEDPKLYVMPASGEIGT